MAVGMSGIDDDVNHSILFLHKENSKSSSLRVCETARHTGARLSAQRGIPVRCDGTLRLLETQQLSRTPDHTGTRVSEDSEIWLTKSTASFGKTPPLVTLNLSKKLS